MEGAGSVRPAVGRCRRACAPGPRRAAVGPCGPLSLCSPSRLAMPCKLRMSLLERPRIGAFRPK